MEASSALVARAAMAVRVAQAGPGATVATAAPAETGVTEAFSEPVARAAAAVRVELEAMAQPAAAGAQVAAAAMAVQAETGVTRALAAMAVRAAAAAGPAILPAMARKLLVGVGRTAGIVAVPVMGTDAGKGVTMRKALLLTTALTLGALNPAFAGGPVIIADDVEVVEAKPASSGGVLLPLLLLAAVVIVATSGGDGEGTAQASDIRLKEDIRRVGTNHLGLGVYQYRYKGMDGVWEGVMAQEVEVMHPGAIKSLPYGYKAVNYARLGLELKRVA